MTLFFLLFLVPIQGQEPVWKALDEGSADRLKEACGGDTAKLVEAIKRGRPVGEAPTGETKERLTDAFGRETDLWIIVPRTYDRSKSAGVFLDRKSTRLNSSHIQKSRMPSSA